MAKSIKLEGSKLVITFSYNPELVEKVKLLPSRKWNPEKRIWEVPKVYLEQVVRFGQKNGFDLSEIDSEVRKIEEAEKQKAEFHKKLLASLPDLTRPLPGKPEYKLKQHQIEGVKYILNEGGSVIVADQVGLGKQQPVDTNVLTPQGWKKISELKIGDSVIGSQGKTVKVTGIFPQGIKPSYKVTFSDHSTVEAGPEHLWTIKYRSGHPPNDWKELTLTTEQLRLKPMIQIFWKDRYPSTTKLDLSKHPLYLPMLSNPVEFENVEELAIPPYTLGALIANGSLKDGSANLSINSLDTEEILGFLENESIQIGRNKNYDSVQRLTCLNIITDIKKLGLNVLSANKFIPKQYLLALVKDRISLLHGLMDGDGSVSATQNRLTYHTKSLQLAKDFQELVECLGGIASINSSDRGLKGIFYSVRLRLPKEIKPFRIKRKLEKFKPSFLASPTRTVCKVEYVREVESVCISVDAKDGLYLTEHCILTHNTLQALALAKAYYENGCDIIVVASVTLHDNWKREASWMGINLENIYSWAKIPSPDKFNNNYYVIFDEAHRAQGADKTIRGKAFLALSLDPKCMGVQPLTGTPMRNSKPINLQPLLQAIKHPIVNNARDYQIKFCGAKKTMFSAWDTSGASNLDELHRLTKNSVLRRLKSQCLDLPPLTRVFKDAEFSADAKKVYFNTLSALEAKYYERLRKKEIKAGGEALVILGQVRQAASIAKCEATIEMAEEILEQGNSVVIFTAFKESAKILNQNLGGELLTGDSNAFGKNGELSERQQMIDRFQSGKSKVFVGTIGAGGEGITLTKSSYIILHDRGLTPGDCEQVEGRVDRQGQTENVTSIWLQGGTADKMIDKMLTEKQERIELVLAGKRKTMCGTGSITEMAMDILTTLFD